MNANFYEPRIQLVELNIDSKPNIVINDSINTNKFFSSLLLSQIEIVGAVAEIENRFNTNEKRSLCLETTIKSINSKLDQLDETINCLKSMVISSKEEKKDSQEKSSQTITSIDSDTNKQLEKASSNPIKKDDELSFSSFLKIIEELKDLEMGAIKNSVDKESVDLAKSKTSIKANESNIYQIQNYYSGYNRCLCCANKFKLNGSKGDSFYFCSEINEGQSKCTPNEEHRELQRMFNKRVKYEVNRKFGKTYLAEHQVRELDVKEMHKIKRKVLRIFSPFPLSVKAAWSNAMNSLRQDRHQLKKRKNLR